MSDHTKHTAVEVTRIADRGMITLRAALDAKAVRAAVHSLTGLGCPDTREIRQNETMAVAWMSPDELLVMCPDAQTRGLVSGFSEALGGAHHLVVDVSDARALFRLDGGHARDVLAKGAPVDLSRDAFRAGQIRRTRVGQVAAAFWISGEESFDLVCFQSVAEFMADWLATAAQGGHVPAYY